MIGYGIKAVCMNVLYLKSTKPILFYWLNLTHLGVMSYLILTEPYLV